MTATKFAAPALLLALALAADPVLAQQRFGRPADGSPANPPNCSLSRSCAPGPYVSVIPLIAAARGKLGTLRLDVRPSHAEVYVDGIYAGRADDFDGASQRGRLMPGTYRIDVRAEGYTGLAFETRIEKGRTTVHRGTLPPATVNFGR